MVRAGFRVSVHFASIASHYFSTSGRLVTAAAETGLFLVLIIGIVRIV